MTGFTNPNRVASPTASEPKPFSIANLSSSEIEQYVRRGRLLRAAHLAVWGQQMIETWKSLFRRPGRLVVHSNAHPIR